MILLTNLQYHYKTCIISYNDEQGITWQSYTLPKKIRKIYESRGNPLSSADIRVFCQKSSNFAISGNTDIDKHFDA